MNIDLSLYQKKLLRNIINKGINWENDYDSLFVQLIPFIFKLIKNNTKWKEDVLLEENDFLANSFVVYTKLIDECRLNKKFKENEFLIKLGSQIRNMCRKFYLHYNKNGQCILNNYYDVDDCINLKLQDFCTLDMNYYLSFDFFDENSFIKKILDLLLDGKTINEIAIHLNIKKHIIYRQLANYRKRLIELIC